MRAMVFDHYGEPDVMSLRDVPIPEPLDGEVLIRVSYAGVNPSDSKARSGQSARGGYRYREVSFPFVTGMDAAGIVEQTGSNVIEFRRGDRVVTWSAADGKTWGSGWCWQFRRTIREVRRVVGGSDLRHPQCGVCQKSGHRARY